MIYAEVIGDPVAHSKSPLIHDFWLQKLGLEGDYRATQVPPDQLSAYFEARRGDPDWRGCNVTMPHKRSVIPFLHDGDSKDPNHPHNRIGSVNVVAPLLDGALGGVSSDVAGFLEALGGASAGLRGKHVVLIGAGGSARAVAFAMFMIDPGILSVYSRSTEKAERMLQQVHLDGMKVSVRGLHDPLPPASLLINATPLGMVGQPPLPIDLSPLADDAIIFDLVYDPVETSLLQQAKARGLRTINGLEMLIAQAAHAFVHFFGRPAPREHDAELRVLLAS